MRTTYLLLAGALLLPGAGAVLLATRGGDKNAAMNADLKKDLELASSTDGITLANSSGDVAMQVVSAIERTTPPARQQTPTTRVRRHRAAPKAPPQVVRAEAPASVNETELQSVSPEPVAYDPTPVSPRPQPVAVSYPSGPSSGGDDGRVSTGSTTGAVIGSILGTVLNGHAVIRGGAVGGVDRCDPRSERRSTRGGISSSQRFPLPGRVSGTNRSGGISIGGVSISSRPPRF